MLCLEMREARGLDFPEVHLFGAACTFAHKRTTVITQIEVDDDELPAGAKRLVNRAQYLLWMLEMVVSGTDERHVDGASGQVRRRLRAPDGLHNFSRPRFRDSSSRYFRNAGAISTA